MEAESRGAGFKRSRFPGHNGGANTETLAMIATKDQVRTAVSGSKSYIGGAQYSTFRQKKESRMDAERSPQPTDWY